MPKLSAGIMLYRSRDGRTEVLIAHPGGPFWARKDDAAWSIPKGEYTKNEEPLDAARREFHEELGLDVPGGEVAELGAIKQSGAKIVTAFAIRADLDVTCAVSNEFEMEWPPRSGTMRSFPEVDRVAWFDVETARVKLLKGQRPFLDRLLDLL